MTLIQFGKVIQSRGTNTVHYDEINIVTMFTRTIGTPDFSIGNYDGDVNPQCPVKSPVVSRASVISLQCFRRG